MFKRKTKEPTPAPAPQPPAKPPVRITDEDRVDYFLGKTAASRDAVDSVLLQDERFVLRKKVDQLLADIRSGATNLYSFGYDENRQAKAAAAEAELKRMLGLA